MWGGSTSVGSNAIEPAVAAGYDVATTASPHNWDYLRSLGASAVFDHAATSAVDDLVRTLAGGPVAGALALGQGSAERCAAVLGRCRGDRRLVVASTPVSFAGLADPGRRRLLLPRLAARIVASKVSLQVACRRRGITVLYVFGTSLKHNDVSRAVNGDFLPDALQEGRYVAAPPAEVVGHRLEDLQPALDRQRRGVSARKLVVRLDQPE